MTDMNAIDSIAMTEAKRAFLDCQGSEVDKLKAAMKATKGHWMFSQLGPNEGRCMRAAVGGVLLALGVDHPFAKRVAAEHRDLGKLSAALEALQRGIPVDLESMVEQQKEAEPYEKVGLMDMWKSLDAIRQETGAQ